MPVTSAQIDSTLRIKKEFNLITGAGTLTDLSNWAGIGVIAPDTAKVLLWIVTPTGATLYKNAGYDTDTYTSPDFTLVDSTHSFTIPQDVNGDYITGVYTVYAKAQVVDGGDTVYGSASSTAEVCNCSVTISIDIDVDYATAVLTSTDTTSYGAYSSLTRTHTIYPPPISGLPNQTTNATTNVYSNIVTTTWSVEISSDVTYLKANDTYTTCRLVGSKEVVVEADTLCNTLCLIKKFRTDFYSKYGKKCVDDMEKAYNLAMDEFYLAFMATRCGRPQTEVQAYIDKIYEITGLDPNCDCGCNAGDYPTPVVPTSIINGTDGTDGVTPQFQNTGTWIQVSYDEGNTWNNLFSLASVTGAAGANGTNGTDGADGVAVLHNDITNDTTATNALETLKSFTMTAGQLATVGDIIDIRARFTANPDKTQKECYVYLDGAAIAGFFMQGDNSSSLEINVKVSRTGASAGKADTEIFVNAGFLSGYLTTARLSSLSSVSVSAWASALDIEIKADDNGGNAITCELFQVTYYKI